MGMRNKIVLKALLTLCPMVALPLGADHCCSCCAEFAMKTKTMFPTTCEALNTFCQEAKLEIEKIFAEDPSTPSFQNTVIAWNEKVGTLIHRLMILQALPIITENHEVISMAKRQMYALASQFMQQVGAHPESANRILDFAENAHLDSHELFFIINMLEGGHPAPEVERRIRNILEKFSEHEKHPFTYRKGEAEEKEIGANELKVMSLNVCNLQGNLPLVFGGIISWKDRVQGIVAKIKELNPDVLCLQEVFEYSGNEELFEELKGDFAHFYLHIGPKNPGFSFQTFGLSSGLFVASKYPIKDPQFRLYETVSMPINRGVFNFKVAGAHIYNTHLEAFSTELGADCRKEQMGSLIAHIEKDHEEKQDLAVVACGDFNIHWRSEEPAKDLLIDHFVHGQHDSVSSITMANRTYLDYTDFWWKAHADKEAFIEVPEIFDFALLWKKSPGSLSTKVISMNEDDRPMHALSDHHALLTTISWEKE